MHDLVIKDAVVVDGTGAPGRPGDLAVDDGHIRQIGTVAEPGRATIDAAGRVVAPGFVDVHTHLDVQGFWDPTLSPTPLHGITTVFGGNCGFSVAPLRTDTADYLMRMLARVEDMPIDSLASAVPWDWTTTEEYLDRIDGTLTVNTGFMVGHSALRSAVMGADANQRPASPAEIDQMATLLAQGLAAGGLGFSSTNSPTHLDGDDLPVPSRHATPDEFVALAAVCRDHPGTSLEFIPGLAGPFGPGELELMTAMSRAADRPLNWNVMLPDASNVDVCLEKLRNGTAAAAEGARIVGLAITGPTNPPLRFRTLKLLDGFGALGALDDDAAVRLLSDPAERARLEEAATRVPWYRQWMTAWASVRILQTFGPATAGYEGQLIGDAAGAAATRPFELLCDIVVADRLRTVFEFEGPPDTRADWSARVDVWKAEGSLVGGSDAGAHIERLATFNYATTLLAEAVRHHGLLSVEEAVHLLTGRPADLYGLVDRGRLAEGAVADLVIFDVATVGPRPLRIADDLPGGSSRLFAGADGIGHVVVAGTEIVRDGAFTGARPGRVLRSGVDTRSPAMT